jgi:hypothetical protein
MSRRRTDSDEANNRLWAYAAHAEAHPPTRADLDAWLLSLSGLSDFEGKIQQLSTCQELLQHADEDDMLDRDRAIIVAVIARLHKELDATPEALRVRRRLEYVRTVAALNIGDCSEDPI